MNENQVIDYIQLGAAKGLIKILDDGKHMNDLRFEFAGNYELESKLKSEIEHVLKAQGFEVNLAE